MDIQDISEKLSWVYYAVIAIAVLAGLLRMRLLDLGARLLLLLTISVLVTETVARYTAIRYGSNLTVYSLYGFIELLLICLYFNFTIDNFARYKAGWLIAATGLSWGIIDTLFFQSLDSINSYYIFVEGILIVGMALYSFFRLLLQNDNFNLTRMAHFWFAAVLCFYWSSTFLNWGLYDYLADHHTSRMIVVHIGIISVNIITYLSIGIIYYFYPKLKTTAA